MAEHSKGDELARFAVAASTPVATTLVVFAALGTTSASASVAPDEIRRPPAETRSLAERVQAVRDAFGEVELPDRLRERTMAQFANWPNWRNF
jgi:hypothetical protein